jgi:hypothetical protein
VTPLALLREIQRRDRVLWLTGLLHVALLVVMALAAGFDSRSVLGLNTWVKPMKFAVSIAIYCWTIAFLLGWLRPGRARSLVSRGTALCMIVEMACTGLQGARATRSHFNDATPFDALLFGVMGLMILANMLLGALLLAQFFRQPVALPPALAYLALAVALFVEALAGQPLVAL